MPDAVLPSFCNNGFWRLFCDEDPFVSLFMMMTFFVGRVGTEVVMKTLKVSV